MLNRVVLIGRLTAAPEIRYTQKGTAKATFRIAVDRAFKSPEGEKTTDFFTVVTWDKLAERCKEWLVKGQMVGVDGRLQMRVWENPQGEKRTFIDIRAFDVEFLARPAGAGAAAGPAGPAEEKTDKPKPAPQDELDDELEINDEDPFREDF